MAQQLYRTIHVNGIHTRLTSVVAVTTSTFDIILERFTLLVGHGDRIHHITTHLHNRRILWHNQPIPLSQHNILLASRIADGLLKVYRNRESCTHIQFHQQQGISTFHIKVLIVFQQGLFIESNLRCSQRSLLLLAFLLCHTTLQTCSFGIAQRSETTSILHQVAQAIVLVYHGIVACKIDRTCNGDILLDCITRTRAHSHLIIRLQHKSLFTIHHKAILQCKREGFCQTLIVHQSSWIIYSPIHIHLDSRSRIGQATCLKHEILHSCVFCIHIHTRVVHLASDGQRLISPHLLFAWNEEHVTLAQWNICYRTIHDAIDVHRHNLKCEVFLQSVHDRTIGEGILTQSFCSIDKVAHRTDVPAQLIHACMEHCSSHLYHIRVSWHNTIHGDRISIRHVKVAPIKFAHCMYRIFCAILSGHTDTLLIGISSKTTCITQQG